MYWLDHTDRCALDSIDFDSKCSDIVLRRNDISVEEKDMRGKYDSAVLREKDMADSGIAVREIVKEAFETELNELEASSEKEIATNV
ncbi:hypothetical protein CYMTET_23294 [Cymbomonas tetramitiformis]|uniref:Uncharacterized protein n=1 Tax=Cymbomonas tetramitiformis TaxID=36881 RepID=A0AAE0L1F3_9CHLO|nr:hypothetical protein CYMTET_23294 [Cymbomonas tetramitiformis]